MSTQSIPTARPAKAVNPDWYESAVVAGWRISLNNLAVNVDVKSIDFTAQRNPARLHSQFASRLLLPRWQIGSPLTPCRISHRLRGFRTLSGIVIGRDDHSFCRRSDAHPHSDYSAFVVVSQRNKSTRNFRNEAKPQAGSGNV